MNGVLPAWTWGTWDEHAWSNVPTTTTAVVQTSRSASDTYISRNQAKRQQKMKNKGLRLPTQSQQLWFEEVLAKVEAIDCQSQTLYHCNPLHCMHSTSTHSSSVIPWEELPDGIHPKDGNLPQRRARNKRHQVENLAIFLQKLLQPGDVVVEFCAGSGYVALPLACLFPQCTFVLLDKKEPSLAIAKERVATAGLTNVEIFCGFIDDYDKPFDVGIALHACGEATDMVMQKCLAERAAYVMAPCCVGKVKLSALEYPRSNTFRELLTRTEYHVLAKAADFGHMGNAMARSDVNIRRRRCKSILETDRNMRAEELQYRTFMFVMHPYNATPKNDVIVGVPMNGDGESRAFKLGCKAALSKEQSHTAIFGE